MSETPASETKASKIRVGTVALVGRPNVGKSTLLNALLGERIAIVSAHPQTTRDRILGVLTEKDAQFAFLDTPGLQLGGKGERTKLGTRMNHEARLAAREADVVVFVTQTPPDPKALVGRVDAALLAELSGGKTPVILAINKIDRVVDKTKLIGVLEAYQKAFNFAAMVPIAARNDDGTSRVLREIKAQLPLGKPLYEDDMLTDRPVRFLVAEFVREQVLRRTREEVPHGIAVVVDRFDESGKVPKIDLSIHVDREGHKKIIIGLKGALLKEIGTKARARVEELLGKQVHLALWVRVTPGWYSSERGLVEMGYGHSGSGSEDAS